MTLAEALHAGHGAPAYLLALALTLALAAGLTPRHWWRRPTARGAVVLGGGTWLFGALLLAALPLQFVVAAPAAVVAPPRPLAAGQPYRVHRDLNVRAQAGVGAARVTVIPAGAIVTPTGEQAGDWWRIRYGAAPQRLGWASSLWLRQAVEP
ncbi:SH3 domain-containing protein [Pseudoduganella chitinolytica]|uniref:SH3 domain-containing protein n=1 Tax=Pseudoduganella chitinolytica TaxID=34070 RepID=A0ABY8BJX5_9BURK|nr:SH3 domain-containing protein [Pseudoduganella chitinolytica]WEF34987.1 SH3 domain-containing protein [Pseudoduganella chitinolytica]